MKPTARGVGLVLVIAAVVALGWAYGARSLNAVAVPLLVAGVAAVATVVRIDDPTVERRAVRPGSVGDVRRVELAVRTASATPATVRDAVVDGLAVVADRDGSAHAAPDAHAADAVGGTPGAHGTPGATVDGDERVFERETTIGPGATLGYDVRLDERGEHRLGPTEVAVRDAFGLVERRFTDERRSSVVVYPPVHELRGRARRALTAVADAARRHERGEFDHLREYRRGDPLRDVDWKATAKRADDEPVVAAYTADGALDRVTIVAEGAPSRADELATAAASVAASLLELGVGVTLVLPDETVAADPGYDGHRRLLTALARTEAGTVADPPADAAVEIRDDDEATVVDLGGREVTFDRLRGSAARRGAGRRTRDTDRRADDVGSGGSGVVS